MRSSFTESVPSVQARSRLTTRLRAELGCAVAEQQRCVSEGSLGTVQGRAEVAVAVTHTGGRIRLRARSSSQWVKESAVS